MDHDIETVYDAFLLKFWNVKEFGGTSRTKASTSVFKNVQKRILKDDIALDRVLSLRRPVILSLNKFLPGLLAVADPDQVPLASVRRVLQRWHDSTRTKKEDKESIVDVIMERYINVSLSAPRPSADRASPEPNQETEEVEESDEAEEDEEEEDAVEDEAESHASAERMSRLVRQDTSKVPTAGKTSRRSDTRTANPTSSVFHVPPPAPPPQFGSYPYAQPPWPPYSHAPFPGSGSYPFFNPYPSVGQQGLFVPPPPRHEERVGLSGIMPPRYENPAAPLRVDGCEFPEEVLADPRNWPIVPLASAKALLTEYFMRGVPNNSARGELVGLVQRILPRTIDTVNRAARKVHEEHYPASHFEDACLDADAVVTELHGKAVFAIYGAEGLAAYTAKNALYSKSLHPTAKNRHLLDAEMRSKNFQAPARHGADGTSGDDRAPRNAPPSTPAVNPPKSSKNSKKRSERSGKKTQSTTQPPSNVPPKTNQPPSAQN